MSLEELAAGLLLFGERSLLAVHAPCARAAEGERNKHLGADMLGALWQAHELPRAALGRQIEFDAALILIEQHSL